MKYRKKPVVIDAIRFTEADAAEVMKFCPKAKETMTNTFRKQLTIKTLEGDMQANVGDWIVKGVKGEFYPVRNDIFEMTYEKAE